VASVLSRGDRLLIGVCAALTVLAAVVHYASVGETFSFVVSGLALAALAALVGRSVDQLGDRLGAGATGVLHAALGNLPELFVGIFALRDGLVRVVEAAVIGSILSNLLLVLGLSFIVGSLRHGTQRFSGNRARTTISLMLLAVAGLLVPSLASYVHTPAARHEQALSVIASVVLLTVFVVSIPASLARTDAETAAETAAESAAESAADEATEGG
jgi:Ca2+:H+ antiporter